MVLPQPRTTTFVVAVTQGGGAKHVFRESAAKCREKPLVCNNRGTFLQCRQRPSEIRLVRTWSSSPVNAERPARAKERYKRSACAKALSGDLKPATAGHLPGVLIVAIPRSLA